MFASTLDSTTLNHGLGGKIDNYLLSLVFNDFDVMSLHQRFYGGNVTVNPVGGNVLGDLVGAYYRRLGSNSVEVYCMPGENYNIDQYRLRLWVAKQKVFLPTIKK